MLIRATIISAVMLVPAIADTINAASASQANVETAISNASHGDTVVVPSGTATWTSLAINKAITLEGSGSPTITVNDCTATKQSTANGNLTIKGFNFETSGSGNSDKGWDLTGDWPDTGLIIFRDNDVDSTGTGFIEISTPGGVIISGNDFEAGWDDSFVQPKATGDPDGSWTTNHSMGTADTTGKYNTYVESNYFYGGTNQGIDADDGTRVVFRNNECDYMSFNTHGLATSEDGVRHFEVYNNFFHNDSAPGDPSGSGATSVYNQNWAIWIRGATGVIYGNEIDDMANSEWGDKDEIRMHVRAAHDNSGSSYGTDSPPTASTSSGCGNYPRERQIGQDYVEGTGYVTDPIYIWSNTGDGGPNPDISVDNSGWSVSCDTGTYGTPASFVQEDRDYVMDTARPSYTAYTYPHPALGGGGGGGSGGVMTTTLTIGTLTIGGGG